MESYITICLHTNGFLGVAATVSPAATLTAKTMPSLLNNIKHSIYVGPHTWEPCVPDSLTHRLNPCGHLVVTEMLEVCGRNCVVSKGIKDLDRVFLCPTCLGNERASTPTDEAKEYDDRGKKSKEFLDCDFRDGGKRAIHAKKELRLKGMQCNSVLQRFDREPFVAGTYNPAMRSCITGRCRSALLQYYK
jgi:hypothetical protein